MGYREKHLYLSALVYIISGMGAMLFVANILLYHHTPYLFLSLAMVSTRYIAPKIGIKFL